MNLQYNRVLLQLCQLVRAALETVCKKYDVPRNISIDRYFAELYGTTRLTVNIILN